MRRWHQDVARMRRRLAERVAERERWNCAGVTVLDAEQLGRLRKRHVHGCTRARCGLCHPSKKWHRQGDRARARRDWQRVEETA